MDSLRSPHELSHSITSYQCDKRRLNDMGASSQSVSADIASFNKALDAYRSNQGAAREGSLALPKSRLSTTVLQAQKCINSHQISELFVHAKEAEGENDQSGLKSENRKAVSIGAISPDSGHQITQTMKSAREEIKAVYENEGGVNGRGCLQEIDNYLQRINESDCDFDNCWTFEVVDTNSCINTLALSRSSQGSWAIVISSDKLLTRSDNRVEDLLSMVKAYGIAFTSVDFVYD